MVHSCRDEEGPIDVVDEAATRSLYFGTEARQSTLYRGDPATLALAYTRCMAVSLLFLEECQAVLLLGLGGGSLVHFLLHHVPGCLVDAVERRVRVAQVARTFFGLADDPRLRVWVEPAEVHLERPVRQAYDLILVDLHDGAGMAAATAQAGFFPACRRRLAPAGVLAINLWSGERQSTLVQAEERLGTSFAGQVMYLPVAGKSNRIGLAFAARIAEGALRRAGQRAAALGQDLGLDYPPMLWSLAMHNQRWY
ncbi:MAG: hypothetical protein AB1505_03620 [Candidatus Latescibacterota bacterium]